MTQKVMYPGMVNSPETTITNNINESDTIIYVLDPARVPEPPNLMTLGTGTNAETVKVLEINDNAITVERGFQGVAKSWPAGTVIARNFTEYDYSALKDNIEDLEATKETPQGAQEKADAALNSAKQYTDQEVGEVAQALTTHLAESVTHRRIFIGYDEPLNTQEGDIWLDLNPPRKILADWRMLETVGEQVIDYSGNGYHGEIIGGVTRVPPINDGSLSALQGDGETGYVQTNFNALAGLDNFKVEVFVVINGLKPGATSDSAGWNGIVNHYRTSGTTPSAVGYHISYNEWKDVNEPEVRKGRGFAARMFAINSDNEWVSTEQDLYSYIYADFGDVYKLTFEFDGSIGIATFKVEKVLADGQLDQKWYGSYPLTGVVHSDTNPLVLMASNKDIVDEYGNITLGRVTISTKVKW